MKTKKLMESYLNREEFTPEMLDNLSLEFKGEVVKLISDEFIQNYIKSEKTRIKLQENLTKTISTEHNTVYIPYYEILENINLCVEVESSDDAMVSEVQKKFGETKFSEILVSGNIYQKKKINRFEISEKIFLESLLEFIGSHTNEFVLTEDSIKIEFD